MLLQHFLLLVAPWQRAFAQNRSYLRAVAQALGTLTAIGRRTISRVIWAQGHQDREWSAEYKLHARSKWNPEALFQPVLESALAFCEGGYVAVAVDDTRLHKTGRTIATAFYQRDPLSPKFRFNLMYGLRFLQMSLLLPLYGKQGDASPRGLPVRFEEVPALQRPRKKASAENWASYRAAVKKQNLSTRALETFRGLRVSLDAAGATQKTLLLVGDNSFCNRTLFSPELERTQLLARTRKDVKLCRRAPSGSARFYDTVKFTPEQVRQDESIPWQTATIFHGGQWREVRFKEVSPLYWQSGARQRPLRLLIVAPVPYQAPGRRRKYYRDPAFLLTTDLEANTSTLLQAYFDRWQIEVNHREEKDTLGIGQAQLRSKSSVPRQPAFAVAAYSALLMAGLLAFGPGRGSHYSVLPKWRRNAERPSCLDLVTSLRKEITENPELVKAFGFQSDWKSFVSAAAA